MKKLGYFFLLLIILSTSTSGAVQRSVGSRTVSTSEEVQQPVVNLPGSLSKTVQKPAVELARFSTAPNQAPTGEVAVPDFRSTEPQGSTTASSIFLPSEIVDSQSGEAQTPFQIQLQEAIDQRKADGLPVPASVKFEYQATSADAMQQITGTTTTSTGPVKVVSKTIIQFDSPEQAGYTEWPPLITKENLPPEAQATVKEEDYSEAYRKFMADKIPGIWEQYEFGHEPRVYTFVETIEITSPKQDLLDAGNPLPLQTAATTGQLLTGFTYTGPHIRYILEVSLSSPEVCINLPWPLPDICIDPIQIYYIKAGFEMDWALGLRLPAEAELIGPDQLTRGSDYILASNLIPLDWSSADFNSVGVAPEAGNEFVLRLVFFVGLKAVIMNQDICEHFNLTCNLDVNIDKSTSFTTPFGTGAYFPIPPVDIELKKFQAGLLSWTIGLEIDPNLGSKEISADWQAGGAASGGGALIYAEPQQSIPVGPINACGSSPDNLAQIQLNNFKYHFNQFLIELAATSVVAIDPIAILLPNGISWPASIPITTFDLSPIIGDVGLYAGAHTQCTWDFDCTLKGPENKINLSIPVVDLIPPATSLTATGTPGNNGWYISDVQVGLNAIDLPVGCGTGIKQTEYSFDGTNWNIYTGPFMISNEGLTTVHYRSIDNVGNVEQAQTQTLKLDKTPPTITGAPTTTPNAYGWYNTDVVVHFDAADAISGIDTVTPDQTLSGEAAGQSVTGTAVDMAGLGTSFTVTGINIDKTSPDVSIISPETRVYENTETFNIIWSAADSLSGIAAENGSLDGTVVTNGQLIELLVFGPGPHTMVVEAIDKADNITSVSVIFSVSVDSKGLLAALEYMCNLGWIDKHGICNSLAAKLNAAIESIDRGNLNVAENQLNAFLNELEAQHDKSINQAAYDVLHTGAVYVIDHLY